MIEETTTTEDNPVAETSAPAETTVLGSTEGDNQDWKSTLSDDLKNDPTLSNFKDVESLAKTVVHQQKVLGSRIPIPKTDEEKMEVYNKLGRPETADKYEVSIPTDYKQYMPEEQVNQFKNVAHNIGLNNEQVNALIEYQKNTIDYELKNQPARFDAGRKQSEQTLKEEWGYDYDKNVAKAKRAMAVYGDDDIKQLLSTTEAGNHPAVIKMFARLGEDITEDMAKNTQNNSLAVSPLDAEQEITDIFDDPDHPYHDPKHREHNAAVERVRQLHEKRFPS
tara:strand:+ start:2246 stop:3082 length:837 start_codon:yes stop_codon:yes gene_type:complete